MHNRILAFLLLTQCLPACQQVKEMDPSLAAHLTSQSPVANWENPGKTRPTATNIVFKSEDGGQTWLDASSGLPADFWANTVYADGDKVLLGFENGVYRTTQQATGQTWVKEVILEKGVTGIFPGRTGPYVSCYGTGFFQQIPGTGVWAPMHNALKDKTVMGVLETPDETLLVGCESGIYKSTDGGTSWKQVFADGSVTDLVDADGILIGSGPQGVLRSTDGGDQWNYVLTEDGRAQSIAFIAGRLVAVTRGGVPWKEITADPEGKANRLRTSINGGTTWQRMDEALLTARLINEMDQNLQPWTINDLKQAGKYLFCSLDTGIFRSSDQGKTWELVRHADGKGGMMKLAVSGQTIYVVMVAGC